jgi:hypothetical protein
VQRLRPLADGIILVVTAPILECLAFWTGDTLNQLKVSAPLFAHGKAVILARPPYDILFEPLHFAVSLTLASGNSEWSEGVYKDVIRGMRAALRGLDLSAEG